MKKLSMRDNVFCGADLKIFDSIEEFAFSSKRTGMIPYALFVRKFTLCIKEDSKYENIDKLIYIISGSITSMAIISGKLYYLDEFSNPQNILDLISYISGQIIEVIKERFKNNDKDLIKKLTTHFLTEDLLKKYRVSKDLSLKNFKGYSYYKVNKSIDNCMKLLNKSISLGFIDIYNDLIKNESLDLRYLYKEENDEALGKINNLVNKLVDTCSFEELASFYWLEDLEDLYSSFEDFIKDLSYKYLSYEGEYDEDMNKYKIEIKKEIYHYIERCRGKKVKVQISNRKRCCSGILDVIDYENDKILIKNTSSKYEFNLKEVLQMTPIKPI